VFGERLPPGSPPCMQTPATSRPVMYSRSCFSPPAALNSSPKRRDVVEVRGCDVPVPEVPEYLPRKILINRTAVVRDLDRAGGGARRDGMVEWGDPQLLPVDLDDGVFEGAGDVEGSRLGDPQVEGGRAPRFPPRGDLALRRLPCVAVRVDMPEKAFVGKAVLHVTVSEERALQHSEIHRRCSRFVGLELLQEFL